MSLSTRQCGRLVRALAAREHTGPFGERLQISRVTLDRWILTWRRGGFDALVPPPGCARGRGPSAGCSPVRTEGVPFGGLNFAWRWRWDLNSDNRPAATDRTLPIALCLRRSKGILGESTSPTRPLVTGFRRSFCDHPVTSRRPPGRQLRERLMGRSLNRLRPLVGEVVIVELLNARRKAQDPPRGEHQ